MKTITEKDTGNIGKLCPLCKKGIINYVNFKGGGFLTSLNVEYTSCSNNKCNGFVNIK